jgi:hypothetical protein
MNKEFTVLIVLKAGISLAFIMFLITPHYVMEDRVCCIYAQQGQDFENKLTGQGSLAITALRQVSWINNDPDTLLISKETDEPISGNASLRVDVLPAATLEEAVNSSWSVISTDFIPANDYSYHKYSLEVSAKDVNQLHSKVFHYDLNKKELDWDFIFDARNGTFKGEFSKSILPELGTQYVKFQMWIRPNFEKHSSYLLDNIKIVENGPRPN